MVGSLLRRLLAHPLTRGADLDDPRTTALRRDIVRQKPFLKAIYEEWYRALAASDPRGTGRVLELGSGAGFLREVLPGAICSDIFLCPGIDLVLNGEQLPFDDGSLRAIVMTNVFHHLPHAGDFLQSAARCVREGGVVSMIEPWMTPWARLIYRRLHHEPVIMDAADWDFAPAGPLSGANTALPWIAFHRDRQTLLKRDFPQWEVESVRTFMPLRYLLSGGVSMRNLVPRPVGPLIVGAEAMLKPLNNHVGMFAHIILRRTAVPVSTTPRPRRATPPFDRKSREVAHGRELAAAGAERVWGWDTPAGRLRAQRRADLIARGADLHPGMHVLEIGCGTGLFTEMLARSGATITAVDISPDLLDIARRRNLDPERIRFVAGSFEECELLGPFDAIVGSSVLHHLEVEPSLAKIRSLLKPGGRFSFAEPNMLNPQVAVQKNVGFIKRWIGDTPDETAFVRARLRRTLERAGFVNIDIQPFDWLHPATPRPIIPLVRAAGSIVERIPGLREFAGSLICRASVP